MADAVEDWAKFTVGQLKDELKKKGLDTSGKKADLVARLTESGGLMLLIIYNVDTSYTSSFGVNITQH